MLDVDGFILIAPIAFVILTSLYPNSSKWQVWLITTRNSCFVFIFSGQVNARYPRSELGDVAVRLWNLQEMDRKFGAKARPR